MAVYLKAVLLAIVEGATEFLPVSSTGHLILVESFIELTPDEAFNNAFMIVIQLPAILAVLVYFREDLWPFTRTGAPRRDRFTLWGKVIFAMLPAIALGPLLDDFLEAHLFAPVPVAIALLVGGVILIVVERRHSAGSRPQQTPRAPATPTHATKESATPSTATPARFETVQSIPLMTALYIGLFQCLAMIPGTSRSAATIVGAMLLGASRPAAAEFSFFLAVPTLFAATVYSLLKHGLSFTCEQWGLLGAGSAVSFLVAYAAIAAFMNYIRRRSFALFGVYRIVLAGIVLAAAMLGWID